MAEEARQTFKNADGASGCPDNLGAVIHQRFAAIGGVELSLPKRGSQRRLPESSDA